MDIERIKGAAQQAAGAVKSKVGEVLGDPKMEIEGDAQLAEGKVRSAVGGLKDVAREAADKASKSS